MFSSARPASTDNSVFACWLTKKRPRFGGVSFFVSFSLIRACAGGYGIAPGRSPAALTLAPSQREREPHDAYPKESGILFCTLLPLREKGWG